MYKLPSTFATARKPFVCHNSLVPSANAKILIHSYLMKLVASQSSTISKVGCREKIFIKRKV